MKGVPAGLSVSSFAKQTPPQSIQAALFIESLADKISDQDTDGNANRLPEAEHDQQ
jgi:hypothetical protein